MPPRTPLLQSDRDLLTSVVEALLDGHRSVRPDLPYPESHSDMQHAVHELLRRFEVVQRPEPVVLMMEGDVFVFGSNEAGVHGAGAARTALQQYGAVWGVGFGHRGNSFAIPTKDSSLRTLRVQRIHEYVEQFKEYARSMPDLRFHVTRIGCGLAGYQDADIAPLFRESPSNCLLPDGWRKLIGKGR